MQKKFSMSSFYKLVIKEVKKETPQAVSIAFSIPQELQPAYTFVAGQYVNIKLTLDGKEIRRAYSICSAPNTNELRIAVKAIPNGLFSNFATTTLKTGDILEVGTPEGKFTFEPQETNKNNYAAFVAGSGITPVLSIIKSVLNSEPQSNFVLVYGNKSIEDTLFYNEIVALQQNYSNRLSVHFVFSKTNESELFGRIDKAIINNILRYKHTDKSFEKFYLCGPEEMIDVVASTLKENNIAETAIKYELFTSSNTNSNASTSEGTTVITVLLDDETTTFEMNQKQTLLEASIKKGLDAPYSCQGGVCSSCLARITQGSATMVKNVVLSDDDIAEGLVLTCQAHPTSSTIAIDFDDV